MRLSGAEKREKARPSSSALREQGIFDMTAYAAYNRGDMRDYIPTDEDLKASIEALPKIPGIQE